MIQARSLVDRLGDRAVEVKYEDFLESPDAPLERLAQFCGLTPARAELERARRKIRTHRSYAYRNVPELSEFADQVQGRLRTYEY
jgi:hypothetical protein